MRGKVVPFVPQRVIVSQQLERMLESQEFAQSERMSRFLRFIVEQSLAGKLDMLKESVIGVHVFDRAPGYDSKADPVVRTEARRLRSKLLEYYANHANDPTVIDLPKGGYIPEFRAPRPQAVVSQISTVPPSHAEPKPPAMHIAGGWKTMLAFGTIAIAIAGALWATMRTPSYSVLQSRPFTTQPGYQSLPSFSPDGETVAFCWDGPDGGPSSIWLQPARGENPRRLTTSPTGDTRPVWSPDGRQIAFLRAVDKTTADLYTIGIDGTSLTRRAQIISPISTAGRVDWSPDGAWLLTSDRDRADSPSAIVMIALSTGEKRRVTAPGAHLAGDTDATFSPDGRFIALRRTISASVEDLYIAPAPSAATHLPLNDSDLKRVSFDNQGIGGEAWSPDGRSLIAASQRAGTFSLWRFSRSGGTPVRLTEAGIVAIHPAASKKGNRLAYESFINDSNIWQFSPEQPASKPKLVIQSVMGDTSPQFSPDESRIAFRSNRSGADEIWIKEASGTERQLTHFEGPLTGSPRWSPDGQQIAFDSRKAGDADIYIVSVSGGAPRRFTAEPSPTAHFNSVVPSWSRDGKSIYFASNRTGKWQVWNQPVAAGPARQITSNRGFGAYESVDGSDMYFSKGSPVGGLWRVAVAGGAEEAVLPSLLGEFWGNWALTARGIYYLEYRRQTRPPHAALLFRDFHSAESREIGDTIALPVAWDSGLCASADGSKVLYTQVDRAGTNILIADNFR